MKLGDIGNSRIYCIRGFDILALSMNGTTERVGRLPWSNAGSLIPYRLLHDKYSKRMFRFLTGEFQSSNVWFLSSELLIANVGRWIFVSSDGGRNWECTLELDASSPPKGVLPGSVCYTSDRLYLCEYALDDAPARIFVSDNDGKDWRVWFESDQFRHFHGIYEDPYTDTLWANTGDTSEESAIGRFEGNEFVPVGRGSQQWRAVELTFTPDSIIWGKDTSFAENKYIYRLDRQKASSTDSDPVIVGETDSVLFYLESLTLNGDTYVIASTTSQTGIDSTAPGDKNRNTCPRTVRLLMASESTGFTQWWELFSTERRLTLGDYVSQIPTTDGHSFIRYESEMGIIANPYNTREYSGNILRIPPSELRKSTLSENNTEFEIIA